MNTNEQIQDYETDTQESESVEIYTDDTETVAVVDTPPDVSYSTDTIGYLESIDTNITIIMMIVIIWFCIWNLRSWRTWTVKGGRIKK